MSYFTYAMLAANTFSAVVFITSNYIGNSEIMQGCKEAGIPAFGTLWDFVRVVFFSFIFRLMEANMTNERSDRMALLYARLVLFHCKRCSVYPVTTHIKITSIFSYAFWHCWLLRSFFSLLIWTFGRRVAVWHFSYLFILATLGSRKALTTRPCALLQPAMIDLIYYDISRVRCNGPVAGAEYFKKLYIVDQMSAGRNA